VIFRLVHAEARNRASQACQEAPDGYIVKIVEPTRTLDQNAALWPLLDEISAQVDWHGQKLSAEDWKHVFTSALRKLRVVPNLDGTGFVALGQSSKTMTKREFSELLELATAFAAEHGVKMNV
jgi:hypothetical protein